MPKLNRYWKKEDADPIDGVKSEHSREKIRLAVKATEGYVFCCTVAIGLLQMLSILFTGTEELSNVRYMRTPTREVMSEGTIADYFKWNIFYLLEKHSDLRICQIIRAKQVDKMSLDDQKEVA